MLLTYAKALIAEADGNRTRQGTFAPSSDLKSVTSTRHAVASTQQASDTKGSGQRLAPGYTLRYGAPSS